MKKDLCQVKYVVEKFGLDERIFSNYIHDIKNGFDGNPNLKFTKDGSIFLRNELVGSVLDLKFYGHRHNEYHEYLSTVNFIRNLTSFFKLTLLENIHSIPVT